MIDDRWFLWSINKKIENAFKKFFLTNFIFFIFFRIPKEIIYHLTPFYA